MINRVILAASMMLILLASTAYFIKGVMYRPPVGTVDGGQRESDAGVFEEPAVAGKGGYDGIVEKNIFHPRRTYSDAALETEAPALAELPPVMPETVLKGIVRRPGGEYVAYISINGARPVALHEGDMVDDLQVVSITRTDVKMRWRDRDMDLTMRRIKTKGEQR